MSRSVKTVFIGKTEASQLEALRWLQKWGIEAERLESGAIRLPNWSALVFPGESATLHFKDMTLSVKNAEESL